MHICITITIFNTHVYMYIYRRNLILHTYLMLCGRVGQFDEGGAVYIYEYIIYIYIYILGSPGELGLSYVYLYAIQYCVHT